MTIEQKTVCDGCGKVIDNRSAGRERLTIEVSGIPASKDRGNSGIIMKVRSFSATRDVCGRNCYEKVLIAVIINSAVKDCVL